MRRLTYLDRALPVSSLAFHWSSSDHRRLCHHDHEPLHLLYLYLGSSYHCRFVHEVLLEIVSDSTVPRRHPAHNDPPLQAAASLYPCVVELLDSCSSPSPSLSVFHHVALQYDQTSYGLVGQQSQKDFVQLRPERLWALQKDRKEGEKAGSVGRLRWRHQIRGLRSERGQQYCMSQKRCPWSGQHDRSGEIWIGQVQYG